MQHRTEEKEKELNMKKNNNIVTMPKALKGKTVLVVDDNIMNIMIFDACNNIIEYHEYQYQYS